jgi:tetratricopeptide (TPR) repeat protein
MSNTAIEYLNKALNNKINWQLDEAIENYTKAISINPEYVMAYCGRGVIYNIKKDYDKAIEDYNQVIRLDPNYITAYFNP